MRHLLTIIILFILAFHANGQDLNKLKVEQPYLSDLFIWDNQIIAEKDTEKTDKFFYCDIKLHKLIKLEIDGNSEIAYLAESNSFLFAIVRSDNQFYLMSKGKTAKLWNKEKIFPEFNLTDIAQLVALDNMLVFVTSDKIYYKTLTSTWKSTVLDKLIDSKSSMFLKQSAPQHCLLTNHSLFLGYDYGEWSGALMEIPFVIEKEIVFRKGKRILRDNIVAIKYSKDSVVWFATGLAHMGSAKSGIYKYKNSKLQQVLWTKPTLSLKNESALSAFCLKSMEEPFFIASELGIFKIKKDSLVHVISKNLYISYPMKNYTVGSSPVAMHVDINNNIFIASRSLGVFVYSPKNSDYKFTQLTFD